jgi:hypothetical protein
MPRVSHHGVADSRIDAVFDTFATGRFWTEWHPATRGVEGDTGLYRFRTRRSGCDLQFGRQRGLRQDRGSWLFVCST